MPEFNTSGIFYIILDVIESLEELEKAASGCRASILYTPLAGEIALNDTSFPISIAQRRIIIPGDQKSDPFKWAEDCVSQLGEAQVSIFIPGKNFDKYGTRVGKGGGWYDRFLSQIPRDWLRIGVAHSSQVSNSELQRNSWDEPMDWLLINDKNTWESYKTIR